VSEWTCPKELQKQFVMGGGGVVARKIVKKAKPLKQILVFNFYEQTFINFYNFADSFESYCIFVENILQNQS
jgi:hypothetical protein